MSKPEEDHKDLVAEIYQAQGKNYHGFTPSIAQITVTAKLHKTNSVADEQKWYHCK